MDDVTSLFARVGVDPMEGCQVVDAVRLAQQHHPAVNVCLPLLIARLDGRDMAVDLKRTLANAYPEDHEVVVIQSGGAAEEPLRRVSLLQLEHVIAPHCSMYLYLPPMQPGSDFTDLQETIARLRAPDGCPWDREQTLASLRQDLLSECVEVMEAIDLDAAGEGNSSHIAEELGDVLLLVTMMVQIAIDEGRFYMADVMRHIVTKLIRRHPHVFGDTAVDGTKDVVKNWDAIKAQERVDKGQSAASPLDGVPVHLPSLQKARDLQSKAAKAGLLDREALARSMPELSALLGPHPDEQAVGEVLWTLTALAREHGVNAENALRRYAAVYRRSHEDNHGLR